MARFSKADLDGFRGATLPDLLGPGLKLLFVGINPGLWTAAVQAHFARPGNRFYPALLRAGIIARPITPSAGMTDEDRLRLVRRGVGITNLVARATARADELTAGELEEGARNLVTLVEARSPRVVAVAGVTAYRIAFGVAKAKVGLQPSGLGSAALWVVPNPSGLNAHETIESLARAYAEAALAAGITLAPRALPAG